MEKAGETKPNTKPKLPNDILQSPNFHFLREFSTYCSSIEVPTIFALWCGIATISATMGRRFWYDAGPLQIFPNVGIVLIAGSGRMRKSSSIGLAKKLVLQMATHPKLLDEKITPEAIIKELATADIVTDNNEVMINLDTSRALFADELSTFLNKRSYDAGIAQILIKLFDCDCVSNSTVTRGALKADDVSLTMLASSTVDFIRGTIPADAIGGGLTSRIIFVYSDEPAIPIPFPELTTQQITIREQLIKHLDNLYSKSGKFILTPEAKEFYSTEYRKFNLDPKNPFFNSPLLMGYGSRRFNHILKIAAVLAMCEETLTPLVKLQHIQDAISLLEATERRLPYVLELISASDGGVLMISVLNIIKLNYPNAVLRSTILDSLSHQYGYKNIMEALAVLNACGRILTVAGKAGNDAYVFKK